MVKGTILFLLVVLAFSGCDDSEIDGAAQDSVVEDTGDEWQEQFLQADGPISKDDVRILGWADEVESVDFGDGLIEQWMASEQCLGMAEGNGLDCVSLGEGGRIVLSFSPPIADGDGPDFAVFENSFNAEFLELAFVEVSSNGVDFARFPTSYPGNQPVGQYGTMKPDGLTGFAGKHKAGLGTLFDLSLLQDAHLAATPDLDLSNIVYVAVVDVMGDGQALDSAGKPVYDPYPTIESAGFDLDAVGVLNQRAER